MRTIMNISLPVELSKLVEKTVSTGQYASKSEFIRHLLRQWNLFQELEKSRKDMEAGQGKLLRSFKDLDES